MKILQLTPGTGNFHCGSCVRDHALVRALRALGHDVTMAPLYLPHVVDEPAEGVAAVVGGQPGMAGTEAGPAAAATPLFFGGINVYLQQKSALFRKTPAWLDRWLDAPGLLAWAAGRAGMTRSEDVADLMLSMLRGADGPQAKELDKLIEWLRVHGAPEVVLLSNALLAGMARRLKHDLGAAVICSFQGEDTFVDSLPEPRRRALWQALAERARDFDACIAPSRYYADLMRPRLGLNAGRVYVVPNGIELDGYTPAPAPPAVATLGYFARLCPAKGLPTLIAAFILLQERGRVPGLRLRIAGAQTPGDVPFTETMRQRLAERGLLEYAEFLPNVDRAGKRAFLQSLSVLSVPATYGEAFGLYVLEALASGVPVVQPRHGAFPELLEATGGGLLCAPDDPAALAAALEELLLDPRRARELGARGRQAVAQRFDVATMARGVLAVCAAVGPAVPAARA